MSPVKVDSAIVTEKKVATSLRVVTVYSLTLGGLFKIVAAIKRLGVEIPTQALSIQDFLDKAKLLEGLEQLSEDDRKLTFAQRLADAESKLTTQQREAIAASAKANTEAILHWFFGLPELVPVLLGSISDLTDEEAGKLRPADALLVLTEAVDLLDVPGIMEAGFGFFTRIGALMGEYKRKAEETIPAASA